MTAKKPIIGLTCSTMDEAEGKGVARFHVPVPYVRCVEEAGGLAVLLPTADPRRVLEYLSLVHGVLLIGGDDVDPALYGEDPHEALGDVDRPRDDFEVALARAAADGRVPTLGICRGIQVMNVAFGGTLHQHVPASVPGALAHGGRYDASHSVAIVPGTRLAAIVGARDLSVNSHHHQAVRRLAPRLVAAATAPDGVVEAAEDPSQPFLVAVQWHPERLGGDEATRRLFRAFVAAADAVRKGAEASIVR